MTTDPLTPSSAAHSEDLDAMAATRYEFSEGIDLRDLFSRICRGLAPTLGFAAIGLGLASLIYLLFSPLTAISTSMRVTFAFNGYAKGQYPDHTGFQADDIRAPDVVTEAIKRQGFSNEEGFASTLRAALTIEGIIPPNVVKERDRLRAMGQTPPPYIPDEFLVTLTLPRRYNISSRQRGALLNEIVSVFREKFQRTYANIPIAFGNAFQSLRAADYYEYELILNTDIQNITAYLEQQLDQAKTYRSPSTNLSFNDLLSQTELFSQIRLYETLGLIRQNGLSRNRSMALIKMDYYLRTLGDEEQKAIEEEKVIDDLLAKSEERSQNYVLGIKSQATTQRPEAPVIDQGLIDSLLANDSSNFLVRQALSAGLRVKSIQAQKAQLLERRKEMESLLNRSQGDQSALLLQVQKSLSELEVAYDQLISSIRLTHADFARQQYADAIRISMEPNTESSFKPLAVAASVGAFLGLALGIALSLLGVYVGEGN